MQNKSTKIESYPASTSWENFKMSSNGTSGDIRRSVAEIKTKVSEESKIFSGTSIFNGGSKKLIIK